MINIQECYMVGMGRSNGGIQRGKKLMPGGGRMKP